MDNQKDKNEPKKDFKIAAALKYDVDKDPAPIILASGKGSLADEILKIAEDNNIPLYEDANLVNLLASLEVDTEIPPELYVLVAEVLSFVYKLDRMKQKKEQISRRLTEMKGKD
ncbi:MAG: FhlB domain-containing protein [Candidatus Margulisiibacteriota bacterium]|nr:MAG: hypothetical protein A2X43_05635 [Candidatus Margulisbacteria bacterium GWD2_39_127]OGI01036.1 MAG: hypothetical protein A2X42_12275 [Candidatus Margulisbacteria bacterium GWF2_38_17]OGI09565.1 MAG: hypothetical protein A2X41_06480 [Candidatus Margulisbacteria bacterium GWE2_39_32]PZM82010.1 MAG: FhlB domain-containing protein [Candidatus Margulisiibacteriota bacterium]HCY35869.1 FhlB domain-containing protein [Candidatus Margulisiibacteriota bacterium]